jgi:TolA-binding protein
MRINWLVVCGVLVAGCSKPPAEEYMKKASEAEKAGMWSAALEEYRNLVRERPDHELAEKALFSIAALKQNSLHDHAGAIEGYKKYLEAYAEGEKAPTAMFLIGFLYNNELKNLDSAALYYGRFLERYPDNEMAQSAQFELNNLGKSPDEILPKPEVASSEVPAKKPAAKPPKK